MSAWCLGDVVLQQDAVAAEDVPGVGDHPAGGAGAVHLRQRGHAVGHLPRRRQLGQPQRHELDGGELTEHLGELGLDQLEASDRGAELLALAA
jgi:hypothetical protein